MDAAPGSKEGLLDRLRRYAVIMAGGRGERFWPASRNSMPKQFLSLTGDRSMIQQTLDRIAPLIPAKQTFIALGEAHLDTARRQLPEIPDENFLVEPVGRNTAPSIGLAALHIQKRDPEAVMVILPADHMIRGRRAFRLCLEKSFQWAVKTGCLVLIGIVPGRPETGYGYIERTGQTKKTDRYIYGVRRFVEKPSPPRAALFYRSGRYYWNSGIFVWKASSILEEISRHIPELSAGLKQIEPAIGTDSEAETLRALFPSLPAVSIDYGLLEKSTSLLVVQGNFGWDDLGSWSTLAGAGRRDERGMSVRGNFIGHDNDGCLIYSQEGLIAALGVKNLVIVRSGDAVLVCAKERTQEIKELVRLCRERKLERYL